MSSKIDIMPKNNHKSNGCKGKRGQPTRYKAEYCEQVQKLGEYGLTDAEIAAFFGVNQVTIYRWQAAHPEFCKSLKLGKEVSDNRVERSLFHRASGYSHEAVKIFCDPKSGSQQQIKFTEHYPPDTTACIFWLKNRRPAEWRDRVETVAKTDEAQIQAKIDTAIKKLNDELSKKYGNMVPPITADELQGVVDYGDERKG